VGKPQKVNLCSCDQALTVTPAAPAPKGSSAPAPKAPIDLLVCSREMALTPEQVVMDIENETVVYAVRAAKMWVALRSLGQCQPSTSCFFFDKPVNEAHLCDFALHELFPAR
jgi:hypothetical protein